MTAEQRHLTLAINGGGDWHFTNNPWTDGADGLLEVAGDPNGQPDAAMQGIHYAFDTKVCCQDCTFEFEFRLQCHSEAGVVFRARDASHFYLLHFPNIGQQARAQHFWVALSKMDDNGYLRRVKNQMVRGVPSTDNVWLRARVRVEGPQVDVRVGDYGHVTFEDFTYPGPGHVGIYRYGQADLRDVQVSHTPHKTLLWNPAPVQRTNWSHPLPTDEPVWQQPVEIKQFDDGELLMLVNIQRIKNTDGQAKSTPCLMRSSDSGRSWSEPWEPQVVGEGYSWDYPRLHKTPAGRLLLLVPAIDHKKVYESTDRGRTWKPAGETNLCLDPPPKGPSQNISPAGFLNLRDGSILALMLGSTAINHEMKTQNIWTWGGSHCQAFTSRSEDDGRTWSAPINVDTPGVDAEGNPLNGNLDLTEASAFETDGGRIFMLIRPIYSPWMWQTWSDDGGRTWSPCVRGPFPGYACPNIVRTASGTALIAHRHPLLCIHATRDDGRTWDDGTTIDSGLWAMGALVEIEPDVVLYAYWDSYQGLMRSQRIAVTPSGLAPG